MEKKYIAITIGPIYKVFSLARKTREFWGASILFSLFAKKICEKLLANNVTQDDFLVPHKDVLNWDIKNYGLFLDRIIVKADLDLWNKFDTEIIGEAIKSVCDEINITGIGIDSQKLKGFLKSYALFAETDENKPLESLYHKLNVLELYNVQASMDSIDNELRNFLQNVNSEYNENNEYESSSFLNKYYEWPDFNGHNRIPSIVEVSTDELKIKPEYKPIMNRCIWRPRPDENMLFDKLKEKFDKELKNYHKYYCILVADGDKLGSKLMNSDTVTISGISGELIKWCSRAYEIVRAYGALPIYIGGDDLLCFAPVSNRGKNILELAKELNESYVSRSQLTGTSLSIGISISYYKSPMYESYMNTFDLLKKAKETGNSCCLSYEKHSGSPHLFSFGFSDDYNNQVLPLMTSMNFDQNEKSFLSSVIYKLRANEELLCYISNNKDRIWYFFENNFDEATQKKSETDKYKYLKQIADIIYGQFQRYRNNRGINSEQYIATTNVYSLLKTIRFIKGLDDDKQ